MIDNILLLPNLGAYGTVYKARDTINDTIVAIKKVKIGLTEDGVPMQVPIKNRMRRRSQSTVWIPHSWPRRWTPPPPPTPLEHVCCGSMKFLYGSDPDCYFRQWTSRRKQKIMSVPVNNIILLWFLKDKKLSRNHKTVVISVCLTICAWW